MWCSLLKFEKHTRLTAFWGMLKLKNRNDIQRRTELAAAVGSIGWTGLSAIGLEIPRHCWNRRVATKIPHAWTFGHQATNHIGWCCGCSTYLVPTGTFRCENGFHGSNARWCPTKSSKTNWVIIPCAPRAGNPNESLIFFSTNYLQPCCVANVVLRPASETNHKIST